LEKKVRLGWEKSEVRLEKSEVWEKSEVRFGEKVRLGEK